MSDPFVLLSSARSGTNMLRSAINGTGELRMLGEVFRLGGDTPDLIEAWTGYRPQLPFATTAQKLELFERIAAARLRIGFKIFYRHEPLKSRLWDAFRPLQIIHLIRCNSLAVFTSLKAAEATGQWQLRANSRRRDVRLTIDPDEFAEWRQRRLGNIAHFRDRFGASPRYREVFYEDLVEGNALVGFLRQAFPELSDIPAPKTLRQQSRPLSETIVNYDDLSEYDRSDIA